MYNNKTSLNTQKDFNIHNILLQWNFQKWLHLIFDQKQIHWVTKPVILMSGITVHMYMSKCTAKIIINIYS